jgi:hypothetical protein
MANSASRARRRSARCGASPRRRLGRGDGRVLARTLSRMTWRRCPSRRSVTLLRASSAPISIWRLAGSMFPLASTTVRLTSITVPAGRAARSGRASPGGGSTEAAPHMRGSARFSVSRLDGTVFVRCPPMLNVDGCLVGPDTRDLPGHGRTLRMPKMLSPNATWSYSWMTPPSRSQRTMRPLVASVDGCGRPTGGFCCRV